MSVASYIEEIAPVADYAIIVDPRDNVAVVKTETSPNLDISLPDERVISIKAAIPPGHRFATRAIPSGEFVAVWPANWNLARHSPRRGDFAR